MSLKDEKSFINKIQSSIKSYFTHHLVSPDTMMEEEDDNLSTDILDIGMTYNL